MADLLGEESIYYEAMLALHRKKIAEMCATHGVPFENGQVSFPREDMEMIRAHISMSHFERFWKRNALKVKLVIVLGFICSLLMLMGGLFSVIEMSIYGVLSNAFIYISSLIMLYFLDSLEQHFGLWKRPAVTGPDGQSNKKWMFVPADIGRFVKARHDARGSRS
ncbi:hypothetical protein [Roseibium aggregatum]|uniref:hypothetical protein n=1 Tax=Roseibium aggregatum TaxID=187304 RepID=UPI00094AE36F|nr:hypothetical protein [Roseibium aggregatum]UFI04652.1 hypothetical protein ST40_005835 [Roseibium aggregatum]